MGHALGLIHEHQRPDRNLHVLISNVPRSLDNNFALFRTIPVTTHGVPYDLGSIMHYPSNVGS